MPINAKRKDKTVVKANFLTTYNLKANVDRSSRPVQTITANGGKNAVNGAKRSAKNRTGIKPGGIPLSPT